MPIKALSFKGDKKAPKKRKRTATADDAKDSATAQNSAVDGDAWVSAETVDDISGPVLLVLPATQPYTSISTDQLGSVFAQKVENMVEGDAGSAEPHDVRQVWVATRVVGSLDAFTFKGSNARYLGCSSIGTISAGREAVSSEETFTLEPTTTSSGRRAFAIKTGKKKYLTASTTANGSHELRGDADTIDDDDTTAIFVRMQARFKPQHKVETAEKVRSKISRKELEAEVGRTLDDDEVKRLKRARREGDYHEVMLDVKVKGKHDKYA
ncbi:Hypothetical protein R9X50_00606900 [Acrodontium crateriforme]|uniref:Uncharacterized protein n=1 Tax=Acrodontium crateriforme TaxID=150365 RepID=A0AAQ3RDG9_9PEZI|nr:Hypothetical protein R9X50_00606900 [Acrodontium crateriforme]